MLEDFDCALPTPAEEDARLQDLATFKVAGSKPEPQFDELVHLVAALFDVPIAFVSLIERQRQWFKAAVGLTVQETPRTSSFCTHTIQSDRCLIVPDTREDPRFAGNPYVVGEPGIRFYAGAPLITPAGHRIGSLCVADHEPRHLSDKQVALLRQLAKLAMRHFKLRRDEYVSRAVLAFAEATDLALMSTDETGTVLFVNRAAETMFGYRRSDIVGRDVGIIVPDRFRDDHVAGVRRALGGTTSRYSGKTIELPAQRRDGTEFPIEMSISAWRNRFGTGMGAVIRDISERRRRDDRLLRMAHQDPLTGLANRRRLQDHLQGLIDAGQPFCVLMLDLDGFKDVNDRIGHEAGDTLLQTIALRLAAAFDPDALLSRWGGDEFVAVLPGSGDPLKLGGCASAVLAAIAQPFDIAGHSVLVGVSMGGAIGPNHGADVDEIIASADLALYRAKTDGGRRFRLFDTSMRNRRLAHRALRADLHRASQTNDLVLHYQPKVLIASGAVEGAEALIRWHHPRRGLLQPNSFLPEIENSSLALQIGWWTLDQACRQTAVWRAAGHRTFRMGVNLFAAQFRSGTLARTVIEALERHGLAPDALELEITETIALQHDDAVLQPLRELRQRGVHIAFDDFGTGFASLSTLRRVPLTSIKIDRSFVSGLPDDKNDSAIVRAVIGLAAGLGLTVVAEGIESTRQASALQSMGCDLGQGYFYGRAMSAAAFSQRFIGQDAPGGTRRPTRLS